LNKKQRNIVIILAVALIAVFILSTGFGAVRISVSELISILLKPLGVDVYEHSQEQYLVFWIIRLPRVLMAMVVGASLAITGAAMQGLFRNPLADPSIIGISGGGAMMAALFIVLGGGILYSFIPLAGEVGLTIFTFIGALLTTFLVFTLSLRKGKSDVATMLLAGIAINALAGAVTGFLTFLANDEQLRDLTFWSLGSLGGANWTKLWLTLSINLIPLALILLQAKKLNALSLGESEAGHLGIEVHKLKRLIVVATAIAMGTTVAFCGIIGFIGLVVPHILRTAGGANNQFVLWGSLLGGMVLLTLSDTLARTVASPAEIPIGVITALAGAPVFLSLLVKQKLRQKF
jgi:iron complex transport system permease protein